MGPYENRGFGAISQSEFEELRKAITAGETYGGTDQTSGGAWRLEFLEKTLAILTQRSRHITFWKDLPKTPADSTVIEYARRTTLGEEAGGWYGAGELPQSHDAEYDRKVSLVKFLGDVREIDMPFLYTKTIAGKREETTRAGTMWILTQLEKALMKGNSKLGVAGAESVEIDGLETYVSRDATSDNIINLWGEPLGEGHLENGGQVIINARGIADHVYMPNEVLSDYSKAFLKNQWVPTPTAAGGISVGMNVNQVRSVEGDYTLRPLFIYKGITKEQPITTAHTRAPSPDPSGAITGMVGTTGGYWGNSLGLTAAGAGSSATVAYKVAYGNKYGESVPVVTTAATQAVAYADRAKKVRLTITNPAAWGTSATHLIIFRQDTDADGNVSDWGCVGRVALTTAAVSGTTVWDDDGTHMPGTYKAWQMELTSDVLHASELLPFTRIPLPPMSLSERFALVQFLSFVCRIPTRIVEFRNIGRRTLQ